MIKDRPRGGSEKLNPMLSQQVQNLAPVIGVAKKATGKLNALSPSQEPQVEVPACEYAELAEEVEPVEVVCMRRMG